MVEGYPVQKFNFKTVEPTTQNFNKTSIRLIKASPDKTLPKMVGLAFSASKVRGDSLRSQT